MVVMRDTVFVTQEQRISWLS